MWWQERAGISFVGSTWGAATAALPLLPPQATSSGAASLVRSSAPVALRGDPALAPTCAILGTLSLARF